MPELSDADRQMHRKLAVSLFNRTWELLDKPERAVEEVDEMIHSAHASRLHWNLVGTGENWLIGEWQVSRVYAVLGRFEPSRHHAERALALAETHRIDGFNRGICYEALARAWTLNDKERARDYLRQARQVCDRISDADERKVLEDDLQSVEAGLNG